jgi:hypothetical protein
MNPEAARSEIAPYLIDRAVGLTTNGNSREKAQKSFIFALFRGNSFSLIL